MEVVYWAILVLLAMLGNPLFATTPWSGDLAWQRQLGRIVLATHAVPSMLPGDVFTAPHAPWVAQEWLLGVVLAVCGTGRGFFLAQLCIWLATLAIFMINARRARAQGAAPFAIVVGLGLLTMTLAGPYGLRAHILGLLCLSLFLWLCEGREEKLWRLIPLTIVWANMHASVMLAPVLAVCMTAGVWWADAAFSRRVRDWAGLSIGIALATLCTPLGAALPRYALRLVHDPIVVNILEWARPTLADAAFAFGVVPLLILMVVFGKYTGLEREQMPRTAFFTVLCFTSLRQLPVFAIGVVPLAAAALSEGLDLARRQSALKPDTEAKRLILRIAGGLTAGVLISTVACDGAQRERIRDATPFHALALLSDTNEPHRIFCEKFEDCSPFADTRTTRAFLDGRADPFPPRVWAEFLRVDHLEPGWQTVLQKYHVDRVLTSIGSPLDERLAKTEKLVTTDPNQHLYRYQDASSGTR